MRYKVGFISSLLILLILSNVEGSYSKEEQSAYDNRGDFRKPKPSGRSFHSQQEAVHHARRMALYRENANKYRNHVKDVSEGGFEESDTSPSTLQANTIYKKQVLTSGTVQTQTLPSRARYRNREGDLNASSPLTAADIHFLSKLAEGMKDENISSSVQSLLNKSDSGELWSKSEYDFLSTLAANINNDQAALKLNQIAEKRRKAVYEE